jgi:hypothetical protein
MPQAQPADDGDSFMPLSLPMPLPPPPPHNPPTPAPAATGTAAAATAATTAASATSVCFPGFAAWLNENSLVQSMEQGGAELNVEAAAAIFHATSENMQVMLAQHEGCWTQGGDSSSLSEEGEEGEKATHVSPPRRKRGRRNLWCQRAARKQQELKEHRWVWEQRQRGVEDGPPMSLTPVAAAAAAAHQHGHGHVPLKLEQEREQEQQTDGSGLTIIVPPPTMAMAMAVGVGPAAFAASAGGGALQPPSMSALLNGTASPGWKMFLRTEVAPMVSPAESDWADMLRVFDNDEGKEG